MLIHSSKVPQGVKQAFASLIKYSLANKHHAGFSIKARNIEINEVYVGDWKITLEKID